MKTIPVKNSDPALVDDADYALVSAYTWSLNNRGYATAAQHGLHSSPMTMHELVAGKASPGFDIHHKNGIKLDNTRNNLEHITESQHQQMKKVQKNNTSGYKGICFNKARCLWQANISINGKTKYLGRYPSAEEAAQVYDEAALRYFGSHAFLNFPLPPSCQQPTTSTPPTNDTKLGNPAV